MAEPFGNPNKQQIEKARELYGDPVIYWAVNTSIRALKEMKENKSDMTNSKFKEWVRLTRLMFINIPSVFVWNEFEKIAEDVANDTYEVLDVEEMEEEVKRIEKGKSKKGTGDPSLKKVIGKLNITAIAEHYGLVVKNNKCLCPFHDETDPSCVFWNDINAFRCYGSGCGVRGDVVKFVQMMEELKK